eukprot:TRINITY_DN5446_c0_g1_i1.p1 TRINITY_DN5446_c0_g1~~TRINITY_DN5446_c0_g1_i1.p1  ORF type:complete len:291 (+),score=109.46 TRINITY_DN5446_c0_g1_i1:90-875(+)
MEREAIFDEVSSSDDDHNGDIGEDGNDDDVKPLYPVDSVAELALEITERLAGKHKMRTRLADALIKSGVIDESMRTLTNPIMMAQKMLNTSNLDAVNAESSKKLLSKVKNEPAVPQKSKEELAKEAKTLKKQEAPTAGKGWFNMKTMADQEGSNEALELLRLRTFLDPKKHFKKDTKLEKGQFPKVFQFGTVVAGAHEFYSSRLSKKERAPSILDEILKDKDKLRFVKRKFQEIRKKNPVKRPMQPFPKRAPRSGSFAKRR